MKIYLRPITQYDDQLIIKWHNTPSVLDHCFNKKIITKESNAKFFKECILSGKYIQFIVEKIVEPFEVASYSIATVYLKDIDKYNNRCELCIFTSNEEEWNTESQRIAIQLLLDKAFTKYNMNKVYTYVFCKHLDEIELFKSVGFSEECILKNEAIDIHGNVMDVMRLCFFNRRAK